MNDQSEPATPLPPPEIGPAAFEPSVAEQPVIQPGPPALPPVREAFTFHGDAREYFHIWIVNTLLTLLTCGIFAAWAKVRKRRYLRGNTEFMGHRFDYRADPRRILVGNAAVAVLFIAYMVVGAVYPWIRLGAFGVGVVLLPWVVIRSLAFNAHNTCYRGMRFYFHQTYGYAALVFIGQFIVVLITLGLYYPAWVRRVREFTISNHRLGDGFFRFKGKSGPFYTAYLVGGAIILGAGIIGSMVSGVILAVTHHKVATGVELVPFLVIYSLLFYLAKHYIYACLFNHVWNHTTLDRHRFVARLEVGQWLKLQLVNLGALIVSCGLLYPWAVVRSTDYALSCLEFEPAGPIERISRLGKQEGSALGETAGEFIGLDFGL